MDNKRQNRTYEAWQEPDACEITFTTAGGVARLRAKGVIGRRAKLLLRLKARTYEEAQFVFHERMAMGRYRPLGPARKCPNACGETFYPGGSGECPRCGRISPTQCRALLKLRKRK